jgi:signal transduction histidine kinase
MPPSWGEHRYGRPRRLPPWWPSNEPWPPQDDAGWRELRRGFIRRAGCFFLAVLTFIVLLVAAVIGLVQAVAGPGYGLAAGLVLVVVFVLIVGRVALEFRRAAEPVADLIEASGRVEAGELDVQVPERGRREVRGLTRAFNAMSSRLSATERERRRLLAEVSHELRTPLTVIQGNIEAILDGVYPADPEHLERIRAEARQLERLIDDLRTLSLAETGQLPLQREPTDVDALAREVAQAFEADAQVAGVSVVVDAPANLPELEVDGRRIRQVLSNLVANAMRHTPRGGSVTVSASQAGKGLRLVVADTGVGMSKDAVDHAFDRFWRSGESAGAGLGLAIVRDLVTAHGGNVAIESSLGAGTRVTVDLPAAG